LTFWYPVPLCNIDEDISAILHWCIIRGSGPLCPRLTSSGRTSVIPEFSSLSESELTQNFALLDTYLRKRAKDNLAKGYTDVINRDPQQRVDMRFTDIPTQAQSVQQCRIVSPLSQGKAKKPKKGKCGEQEMGVVQCQTAKNEQN
jgi:hypothetical protein